MNGTREKIGMHDSWISAITKLSCGNPGAIGVLAKIMENGQSIDPDCASPLLIVLSLDDLNIAGSRIWMLFKDVCEQNLNKMLAVLRACQLGIISEGELSNAIDDYGRNIVLDDVCRQVKEQLPNFQLDAT